MRILWLEVLLAHKHKYKYGLIFLALLGCAQVAIKEAEMDAFSVRMFTEQAQGGGVISAMSIGTSGSFYIKDRSLDFFETECRGRLSQEGMEEFRRHIQPFSQPAWYSVSVPDPGMEIDDGINARITIVFPSPGPRYDVQPEAAQDIGNISIHLQASVPPEVREMYPEEYGLYDFLQGVISDQVAECTVKSWR